jgi:excisionase family DNA binding protein
MTSQIERRIELVLHSCSDLMEAISSNKIKSEDLDSCWLSVFQNGIHKPKQIVSFYKTLYETALLAQLQLERNQFVENKKENELKRELSYKDAADYLDCSVSTIKRLVGMNKLHPKRYNFKNVRISVSDLENYKSEAGNTFLLTPTNI